MVRSPEQIAERPAPDAAGRSKPEPSPSRPLPPLLPKKRWPRRVLIGVNIFVAICIIAVGGTYGYLEWKFGSIHRVTIGPGIFREDNPGNVMNVLLVGSDSRSELSKADQKRFGSEGRVAGARTDTMMILHADPKEKKAAILSLPRDLYVPSLGDRLNGAFQTGGPQKLIQTITATYGIPIDHYVEVDFNGFRGIVNAVGAVNVYFPSPARDVYSNLVIKNAGCVALNGDRALSYVRSRHYQYYEGGRWHDETDGDLGRIQRQQDFIRRVLRKVKGVRDPLTLNSLINTGIGNVAIDKGLSAGDILKLAKRFNSLSPDAVDMETLPTVSGSVTLGGVNASILRPKQPDAQQLIDRFSGKTTPAPETATGVPAGVLPSTISVRVLNGSGLAGQATKVAGDIGPSGTGLNIAGKGDADNFRYSQSVISYGPGQQAKAQLLAAVLRAPAQLKLDPKLKAVDLVLVVGSDYSGVKDLPGQVASSTTSTTAATTATTGAAKATGKSPADSC